MLITFFRPRPADELTTVINNVYDIFSGALLGHMRKKNYRV